MATSRRSEVEAILAGARAEHRALLAQVSPALRASLPVDAAGITQAIDHLAEAGGLSGDAVHGEQVRGHRTNAAVLHMRVFGREPLAPETVRGAFLDGARVRGETLTRLAHALGGDALEDEVRAVLRAEADGLQALYAAQERAAVRIAAYLDEA